MATVGILFLKPLLDKPLVHLGKAGEFGGETFTTTLAAQLGTLPILLSFFGQFGLLSLLVNAFGSVDSAVCDGVWEFGGNLWFDFHAALRSLFISGISVSFIFSDGCLVFWQKQLGRS